MKFANPLRCILAGLAMATAVASPALAQQRAKLKFVMPTPAATYLLPYFVAQDLGWYRSWGLDMEEQIVQGDANSLRAVIAGDSVVTFIGPPTIMDAVIAGGKIKIFTSWQPVTDYQLITGDKKVRTLKDLEGKRIAVAGPGGMTSHIPLMLMKLAGADGSDVKFLSVGGMSARLQAVAAGKVDATLVDTFFATKAERDGVAHTVASIAKEFPGLGYVFTIARETTLADAAGRTALSIFTKGTINGARFIRKDPAAAAAILKKRLPDEDLGLIQATIEKLNGLNVWGLNGGVEREVLEFSSKTFAELGMVKRGVAYEEIVDPSIVAAVLREVGRN